MTDATQPHAVLGTFLKEHRLRRNRQWTAVVVAGVLLLVALVMIGIGVYRWYFAFSRYGPAVVWRWSAPALLMGGGLGLLALFSGALAWRRRPPTIRVHRRGLSLLRGSSIERVEWRDVRRIHTNAVRYGLPPLPLSREAEITLELLDGRRIRLSHMLEGFLELVETVKRHVYPGLLAEYTAAFNQGRPLAFGPLVLSAQGVQRGKQVLPWSAISQATLNDGHLRVDATPGGRSERIKIPVHQIPNVDLCVQLIQKLGKPR